MRNRCASWKINRKCGSQKRALRTVIVRRPQSTRQWGIMWLSTHPRPNCRRTHRPAQWIAEQFEINRRNIFDSRGAKKWSDENNLLLTASELMWNLNNKIHSVCLCQWWLVAKRCHRNGSMIVGARCVCLCVSVHLIFIELMTRRETHQAKRCWNRTRFWPTDFLSDVVVCI